MCVTSQDKHGGRSRARVAGQRRRVLASKFGTPDTGGPEPERPPTASHSSQGRRFLASPLWPGIAGIAAIVALVLAFLAVNYAQSREREASAAKFEVGTTYRYNTPGSWTLIWTAKNIGPGVANDVHIVFAGVNSLCTAIQIQASAPASVSGFSEGAECHGGSTLLEVVPGTPERYPLVAFARVTDESIAATLTAYSATARRVAQDETIWLEFHFKSSAEFDSRLEPLLPIDETSDMQGPIKLCLDSLQSPSLSGPNMTVDSTTYSAIESRG